MFDLKAKEIADSYKKRSSHHEPIIDLKPSYTVRTESVNTHTVKEKKLIKLLMKGSIKI